MKVGESVQAYDKRRDFWFSGVIEYIDDDVAKVRLYESGRVLTIPCEDVRY